MTLETVDREPLDISDFPGNLQQHVEEGADHKMKMMAAQGMAPAPPEQTVRLLYQLHFDDDDEVLEAIDATVADLPENALEGVVESADNAGLLDWIADKRGDNDTIVETLLRNQSADDLTVARLARDADADICEIIATNEVRVLRTPQIIEQLYQNPNAQMATVDQLIELADRNDVDVNHLPAVSRALQAQERVDEGTEDEVVDDDEFDDVLQKEAEQAEVEDEKYEELEDEDLTRSEREEKRQEIEEELEDEADERRMLTEHDLQQMSIKKKIRLATTGSRATVKKLVKDSNRMVHEAAIESPQLKQPDIVRLSANKSVPDNVISAIANNREWLQNYQIMKNLAFNPKTPVSDSMDLIKQLRTADLKKLEANRDVPHQVARAAKRLLEKRTG